MYDLTDDEVKGVLGEELRSQLQFITENMATKVDMAEFRTEMESRFDSLESRMIVVESVLPHISRQVNNHEHRLTKLEHAA